jgi:hypothetical protein
MNGNKTPSFIEIESHDRRLDFELMNHPASLQEGVAYTLPDGSTLLWQPGPMRKAHGLPAIFHFILVYARDVSAGVLGAYLYDKLKGKATALLIDRQEVQIDKGEITRIITEHIEKKD